MKILIDTNIYLDFYRSSKDTMKLLAGISSHFDKIILTDQIIQEFERNREIVIKDLKKSFGSESALENYSSTFLQHLPTFGELVKLQKDYKSKRKEVITSIDEMLKSPDRDPIAIFFNDLVKSSMDNGRLFITTDDIIQKAQKRKLIGNPPTSQVYSIGDEINWEIIINNVREDIIIVGRDNTYTKNFSFLQRDFHRHTGRFILKLSDTIIQALNDIGEATGEDLKNVEETMIKEVTNYNEYWKQKLSQKADGLDIFHHDTTSIKPEN